MNARGNKSWIWLMVVTVALICAFCVSAAIAEDAAPEVAETLVIAEPTATPVPTPTPTPSPSPTPSPTPTPKPVGRGNKGDSVIFIQAKLRELGFFTGSADGDYGPMTETAIKNLQAYIYTTTREKYLASYAPRTTPTLAPTPTPEPDGEETVVVAPGAPTLSPVPTPEPSPTPMPIPKEALTGAVNYDLMQALKSSNLHVYREVMQVGSSGPEVVRLQMRLCTLDYMLAGTDGQFGPATKSALQYFQKVNKLPGTGIADEALQKLIFSPDALESDIPLRPYMLKVSIGKQKVFVYAWDGDGYNKLVQTFICSTGTKATPTPLGSFTNTGPGARWHYFKKFFCWAQYAYYIDGDIMFHSVLYNKQDEKTLNYSSKANLGYRASHGCIRLDVPDVKWLWDNCPFGTTVVIYS